ncbi:MAG: hypothetical protein K2P54_06785, partial [Odoribacter sp.]|nr:hypothetical protein [Odoribacter sp.]
MILAASLFLEIFNNLLYGIGESKNDHIVSGHNLYVSPVSNTQLPAHETIINSLCRIILKKK